LQHALVLALVAACVLIVSRDARRALRNQASKLAGCGSCKGCATEAAPKAEPARTGERVVFVSADALSARAAARRQQH
jgi:hypothetical protein